MEELPQDIYLHNLIDRLSIRELIKLSITNTFYQKMIRTRQFWLDYFRKRIEGDQADSLLKEVSDLDSIYLYNLLAQIYKEIIGESIDPRDIVNYNSFRILETFIRIFSSQPHHKNNLDLYISYILSNIPRNYPEEKFQALTSLLTPHLKVMSKDHVINLMTRLLSKGAVRELFFLSELGVIYVDLW